MRSLFSYPSLRERTFCISMFAQLCGQLLGRLGREWYDACRLAFLNLSDYAELSPELLEELAAEPPIAELEALFERYLDLRAVISRPRTVRLSPWACALSGRRYPSSVCVDPHCHCRDK